MAFPHRCPHRLRQAVAQPVVVEVEVGEEPCDLRPVPPSEGEVDRHGRKDGISAEVCRAEGNLHRRVRAIKLCPLKPQPL